MTASNGVSVTVNETQLDDYWQNNIFLDIAAGYNQNTVNLQIAYDNMTTSVDLSNAIFRGNGASVFPVTGVPFNLYRYLDATPLVESNNANIRTIAQSITAGCTDLTEVIIRLSQWIEANIKMADTNPSNKSSDVYTNKIADCDGASHLLAAFCRSLGIPARIVAGYLIHHKVSYPTNTGTVSFGSGDGTTVEGHAVCEIYIPNRGDWVRCDPAQRTTLFGNQQFIKIATGVDASALTRYGFFANETDVHFTQEIIPYPIDVDLNPSVFIFGSGGITENYNYLGSEMFPGNASTVDNSSLLSAYGTDTPTGLFDEITIQNPGNDYMPGACFQSDNTYIITPNSSAHFYAKFISNSYPDPTYPEHSYWSIVLYRADGQTYEYASGENGFISMGLRTFGACWQVDVGSLPDYIWAYDHAGNIYGKVKVSVAINDGDYKEDETDIAVIPQSCVDDFTNKVVTVDTNVDGCDDLSVQSVQVTNNAKLILDAGGTTTITGDFEVELGSELEIR